MKSRRQLLADHGRAISVASLVLSVTAIVIALSGFDALRAIALSGHVHLDEPLFVVGAVLVGALAHSALSRRKLIRELRLRQGQERSARELALRDPLTGLLNRRAMSEIAERHAALGQNRALLLCDLDGFKQINDNHGHRAGDAVLREFAQRLSALSYSGVSLETIRLGGDEFVLLAAGAKLDASAVARDVLRCTADGFAVDGAMIGCSTSIGIATARGGETMEALLELADDAMYDAKRNGLPVRLARTDSAGPHDMGGRRMFEQQLDMRASGRTLFAAAVGIDRIHEMRRALGYGLGSKLVRELTQRLGMLDDQLYFERLSSDVLGIAFSADDADAAREILERLRTGVEGPAMLAGASVDLRLTTGLAGPGRPSQVRDLTEQAQAALEDAWRSGARLKLFEQGDHAAASENIGLMADLRKAIALDALEIHYQPKLRIATGEIDSLEALLRWDHPSIGWIPPSRFVPIAEKTGDIRVLTEWTIDRVLADQQRFAARGHGMTVYINVSADLIGDEAFAQALHDRLAPLGGAIGIEITETAVLSNPDRALPHLNRLAEAGVKIAIDDYGVGVSSLAYLKQLPACELKLDSLFITNLATSHRDPMIVRSTIELAHGLGLLVTAEGVEDMEAYALLKVMGCDLLQGFVISKALAPEALFDFLANHDASGGAAAEAAARLRLAA